MPRRRPTSSRPEQVRRPVQDLLGGEHRLPPAPSRKNEMVNNFIKPGLEDLCVSPHQLLLGASRGL